MPLFTAPTVGPTTATASLRTGTAKALTQRRLALGWWTALVFPLLATACVRLGAWGPEPPAPAPAPVATESPDVPRPKGLRPCCAFGDDIGVSVGTMEVPGLAIGNIVGIDGLGAHNFDNGATPWGTDDRAGLFATETNGLIYTCRGGFIDTAHVRDYADWTLFLATHIEKQLDTGGSIDLGDEGGQRTLTVRPVPLAARRARSAREIALRLGQWAAFNLSVWHEIATWYGWSSMSVFPEGASAFSPEDLYSNLVGISIAGESVTAKEITSEGSYNDSVDTAFRTTLQQLGAVEPAATRTALGLLDGVWWDSRQHLPAEELVIRRNPDVGPVITPWRVVASRRTRAAGLPCASSIRPRTYPNPDRLGDLRFAQYVTLAIQPTEKLSEHFPFPRPGDLTITPADYPHVLADVRRQLIERFGRGADRP